MYDCIASVENVEVATYFIKNIFQMSQLMETAQSLMENMQIGTREGDGLITMIGDQSDIICRVSKG